MLTATLWINMTESLLNPGKMLQSWRTASPTITRATAAPNSKRQAVVITPA